MSRTKEPVLDPTTEGVTWVPVSETKPGIERLVIQGVLGFGVPGVDISPLCLPEDVHFVCHTTGCVHSTLPVLGGREWDL